MQKIAPVLLTLAFIFLSGCSCVETEKSNIESASWLSESNRNRNLVAVSYNNIYEVSPTKMDAAFHILNSQSFLLMSCEEAEWYTGHYYQCPSNEFPYLVRSVFGYGGTGFYHLSIDQKTLIIRHESLGARDKYTRSALVVNLPEKINEVIINVSIDE